MAEKKRFVIDWDPEYIEAVLVVAESRFGRCGYKQQHDCLMDLTPHDLFLLLAGKCLEAGTVDREAIQVRVCEIEEADEKVRTAFGNKKVFFLMGHSSGVAQFLGEPIQVPRRILETESSAQEPNGRIVLFIIGACWIRS